MRASSSFGMTTIHGRARPSFGMATTLGTFLRNATHLLTSTKLLHQHH